MPEIAQTVRGTARNLSHKLYKPRDNTEADSCFIYIYIYSFTDVRKGNRHFLWLLSRSLGLDVFLTIQSENTLNRIREVKGQWEQASMDVDCCGGKMRRRTQELP